MECREAAPASKRRRKPKAKGWESDALLNSSAGRWLEAASVEVRNRVGGISVGGNA